MAGFILRAATCAILIAQSIYTTLKGYILEEHQLSDVLMAVLSYFILLNNFRYSIEMEVFGVESIKVVFDLIVICLFDVFAK